MPVRAWTTLAWEVDARAEPAAAPVGSAPSVQAARTAMAVVRFGRMKTDHMCGAAMQAPERAIGSPA
jgi:hypothetical protein